MPSMNFHFHKTHKKSQDNQNYLTIKHIIKHINKVYKMPGRIEIVESKNQIAKFTELNYEKNKILVKLVNFSTFI